jgi:hypothetical protein
MPFHRAQKKSRLPGPNPFPLSLVMDMHAFKTYARGCINHRWINTVVILFVTDTEQFFSQMRKLIQKLSKIWAGDPGSGKYLSRIQGPKSTGSRIRIRNTVSRLAARWFLSYCRRSWRLMIFAMHSAL